MEGDRWRDGARYHANGRGVEAGAEVRIDGERNRGREGLNQGEQHPFYVQAGAGGVPPFSCLCTTLKYLPAYSTAAEVECTLLILNAL